MSQESKKRSASSDPAARYKARPPSGEPTGPQSDKVSDEDREREIGGRKGPDPTRYGDWEKNGRCIDF